MHEARETLRVYEEPGPVSNRHCTDVLCCIIFGLFLICFGCVVWLAAGVGDLRRIDHGRDHYGNLCGLGNMTSRPLVYYPRLDQDFKQDPTLRQHYGLCVSSCPKKGTVVDEYGYDQSQNQWLAVEPSFPVFHRCIPYEERPNRTGTLLCAFPSCQPPLASADPSKAQQVCGLKRDGTDTFWLLEEPDTSIQDGWRAEGASMVLVEKRVAIAKNAPGSSEAASCQQRVKRKAAVSIVPSDEGAFFSFLTSFTSPMFQGITAVRENQSVVFGVGVGGSVVLSIVLMMFLPVFAEILLFLLFVLLVLMLGISDYVLFVLAGIATGRTGRRVEGWFSNIGVNVPKEAEDFIASHRDDDSSKTSYAVAAIVLLVVICLFVCSVCAMAKHLHLVVQLLQEAGMKIRRAPGLLLLPMLLVVSLAACGTVVCYSMTALLTAGAAQVSNLFESFGVHDEHALDHFQKGAGASILFGFAWLYFFHVAVFIASVALNVSRAHFSQTREGCWARAAVSSLCQVIWYHTGSLAMGSFLVTVVSIPKWIIEFIQERTKDDQTTNSATRTLLCVTACCLRCLDCCLKFITQYAYVNMVIECQPFWTSCKKSFKLFADHPVQLALNSLTSYLLGCVVCVTVPLSLVFLATFLLPHEELTIKYCGIAIAALAYVVTRMVMGVYDAVVTTLFVCVMRDQDFCHGRFTSIELKNACGVAASNQEGSRATS